MEDLRTTNQTRHAEAATAKPSAALSVGIEPPSFSRRIDLQRPVRRASRGYSRFVAAMKVVLPAAALAMVGLMAVWPSLYELPSPRIAADRGQLEMINPRYFSADEQKQPYSVTAVKADRSADDENMMLLDQPQAEMTESDGTWVTIRSNQGWYDQQTGILRMRGDVHVMRDDGNEFTTAEADADVKKGTAWGDVAVVGQGPQGEINANGFRMTDRGKSIIFLNSSSAQIQAAQMPPAKNGDGEGAPEERPGGQQP